MNTKHLTDKTLFISRQLDTSSHFQHLKIKGWSIIDQSLLKIEYLEIESIPSSDWIFFYSSNAVKAFAENVAGLKFSMDSKKIAAYGPGTADVVRSFGWPVDFMGTGELEGTLKQFNLRAAGSNVLFPRALNSRKAMVSEGIHTFHPIDLVVYKNSLNPAAIPECGIYIFTSSMNVESFFSTNKIPPGAEVIAIGPPTAKTIGKYYNGKIKIPPEATEKELYNLINKYP